MENKQTAAEWLINQLEQKGNASVNASIGRMQISIKEEEYIDIIQKAKQMEKEQIKDAHLIGLITSMEMEATKQAEQYYNETYKQQENDN